MNEPQKQAKSKETSHERPQTALFCLYETSEQANPLKQKIDS